VGVVAGGAALWLLVPAVAGVPWAAIAQAARAPSWPVLVGLGLVWLVGLVAHTTTLGAALPGLGRRRALLLSLTGSAVSNVLPAGGAAGIALNYRMARAWGHDRAAFARYTVLTNLWDVLTKLAFPVVALAAVQVLGPRGLVSPGQALLGGAASVAATAVVVLLMTWPGCLARVAAVVNLAALRVQRAAGRPPCPVLTHERIATWRNDTRVLAARRWRPLTAGTALYSGLLVLLLGLCLWSTGGSVPLGVVLLASCVERLATLLPVTPGGVGLVELGLVGVLTLAPGGSAAGIASGVLLYRALTFGLEIPVGGALLAWWELRGRRRPGAVR
jgi:uncharacterized membrane protein YbhN (UPF0104 family)